MMSDDTSDEDRPQHWELHPLLRAQSLFLALGALVLRVTIWAYSRRIEHNGNK